MAAIRRVALECDMEKFVIVFLGFFLVLLPLKVVHAQTTEENAVYNSNNFRFPTQAVAEKPADQNILQQLAGTILSKIGELFASKPTNPDRAFSESDTLQQAENPAELVPENAGVTDKLKGFLGGSTGYYRSDSPDFGITGVNGSECQREQEIFPPGLNIRPITQGQGCNQ